MEKRLLALLRLAVKMNATDIHFNQKGNETRIEMRIDDRIKKVKGEYEDGRLIRYLQYLANMDVGNQLFPQTGQFEWEVDGVVLSLRFALICGYHFTNAVLRILNHDIKIDPAHLSSLSFQNDSFQKMLQRDYGLILFSGPTGSGKTTTLYSLLNGISDRKIYTIEDPIEVYYDSFVQLQVNEAMHFDYADGIRQILRHDPDVIMIGEIRDDKAARMAVVAANTGHLVLSTIHASKASSVISRMLELGVNEDHLYEVLVGLINQRLIYEQGNKKVYFEIMEEEEIAYFRKTGMNSPHFISLQRQKRGSFI